MSSIFKEIRILRDEGKLHRALLFRTRLLSGIGCLLAAIAAYNVAFRSSDGLVAGALFLLGGILGMYIFSKMSAVDWNEEKEVVEAGRMTIVGYATLGLYIAFEISLRTFLADYAPLYATTYLLAGISGTLLGRSVGTLLEIHAVYRASRDA